MKRGPLRAWEWLQLVVIVLFFVVLCGADADCDGVQDGTVPSLVPLLDHGPIENGSGLEAPAYFKDVRTGFCFASYIGNWDSAVVLVPCEPVVRARIRIAREQALRGVGEDSPP